MLDELKSALTENRGDDIPTKEFLNEAIMWLEYIESLEGAYSRELDLGRREFMLNDITMNYCTLLNWVSIVWFLRPRVSNRDIAQVLIREFSWPPNVAESFMNCVRNPTAHMGRAYMWGEYQADWRWNREKHGEDFTFTAAFDPNVDPYFLIPPEAHPSHDRARRAICDVGYVEWPDQSPPDCPKIMNVTFYFSGFRTLMEKLVLTAFERLKTLGPEDQEKFEELRLKLSITRVPAPENGG